MAPSDEECVAAPRVQVRVQYTDLTLESRNQLEQAVRGWLDWHVSTYQTMVTAALYVQRYSGTFEHLPELAVPGTSLVWVDKPQSRGPSELKEAASFNARYEQEGDVPRYVRGTSAPLERAAADVAAGAGAAIGREAPSCFNCGSYGHAIKDCPQPRDAEAIRAAQQAFTAAKRSRGGAAANGSTPKRYFLSAAEGSTGEFPDIQPGQLSGNMRAALGLGPLDPPPWLQRMRELGYPPGWRRKAAGPASEEAELFFVDHDPGTATAPGRTGGSADGTAAVAESAAATAVAPATVLREVTLLGGPGGSAAASAQDNDDGDEGPPEAPPTPSDDMDLEDRSPEPEAPAADIEPGPEPEPEPAFPDMELESPTHDAAPPASSLAGARLGATGALGGSGAPPGVAPIRTRPLLGGETSSARTAEAAPAASDGASLGAGVQGDGDELVLFPGLNAPAPAGAIADDWGCTADATAYDSTCTPRSMGTRAGKKRKHLATAPALAEPDTAVPVEPVAMGQYGWAGPGGAAPGSWGHWPGPTAPQGHPPAWGPYDSAPQPTSLPQPSGTLLGEAQGGAGPARQAGTPGAGPSAYGGHMQQFPQQAFGGSWGGQPYTGPGAQQGDLQPGFGGAPSPGGAPYAWPYAAGYGTPPGWPQGPQQMTQQHPQGQVLPPQGGPATGYAQGGGQWPVRQDAPAAWGGCPSVPGQYLPNGAAPHSF